MWYVLGFIQSQGLSLLKNIAILGVVSYESSHHQGAINNSEVWLLTLNCEAQWAPVYFIFINFVASHYATFLLNPRTYGVLQVFVLRHLELMISLASPLRWLSRSQRLGQLSLNRNKVRQSGDAQASAIMHAPSALTVLQYDPGSSCVWALHPGRVCFERRTLVVLCKVQAW